MNPISRVLLCGAAVSFLSVAAATAQPSAPEEVQPLLIGSAVPDAEITSLEGESVSLRDVVANEPTLLIFYRGGW
jgi:hypothetical protein